MTSTNAATVATVATVATDVITLTDAIITAAKGRGKVAALFRAFAEPAYNDPTSQAVCADTLSAVRRELLVKREASAKRMAADDRDAFKRSVENSLSYGLRVAGEAAGCKFKFDQKKQAYVVADLPAANEKPSATANGKDKNAGEQSAALVAAAEAAPVLVAGDRLAHLEGIVSQLLAAGYKVAEIEAAVHAVAIREGKRDADAKAAEKAKEPKAPAILAEKLPAVMASKGAKVKAPRKAKAKAKAPNKVDAAA